MKEREKEGEVLVSNVCPKILNSMKIEQVIDRNIVEMLKRGSQNI